MKRKAVILLLAMTLASSLFVGCGSQATGSNDAEFISDDVEYDDDYTDESYEEDDAEFYGVGIAESELTMFIKFENEDIPIQIVKDKQTEINTVWYFIEIDGKMCGGNIIVESEFELKFAKEGFIKIRREGADFDQYHKYENRKFVPEYKVSYHSGTKYYKNILNDPELAQPENEITEEEFNEFISQHEWIRLDEIEKWYDDIDEAYENMLILE